MAKIRKTVIVETEVELEFDESLIPDDEWRSMFYDIRNARQLAEHLATNYAVNGVEDIAALDGFADRKREDVHFIGATTTAVCED